MGSTTRRTAVCAALVGITAGMVVGAGGAAQAAPTDCVIDRGLVDATAVCHAGTGNSVLYVDCVGFYVPPTRYLPVFGNYRSGKSNHAPVGTTMHASCGLGIALGAEVRPAQ
ncbi:hypothetical protein [Nocardia sp. CC227C]|uniref:hypothetical protein n=1 Tax=Nocardia sp. CC227C TaxID=3044562 RepID=UPI00278BB8E6|nr:hypothetical protein [Nocardia sp. CC227C]